MKNIVSIFALLLCFTSINAQILPTYNNQCTPGINSFPEYAELGFVTVDVQFNDPDGDCISNDFIISFTHASGVVETWHNNGDGGIGDGDNGPSIDFGDQNCCDTTVNSNGGTFSGWAVGFGSSGGWNGGIDWSTTSSGSCGCTFEIVEDNLVVTCPCLNQNIPDEY